MVRVLTLRILFTIQLIARRQGVRYFVFWVSVFILLNLASEFKTFFTHLFWYNVSQLRQGQFQHETGASLNTFVQVKIASELLCKPLAHI